MLNTIRTHRLPLLVCLFTVIAWSGLPASGVRAAHAEDTASGDTARVGDGTPRSWPLWFEPAGSPHEALVAHGAGYRLSLSADGVAIASGEPGDILLSFVGARVVAPRGERPTGGVSHHFIGNDPGAWRRGVPHYAGVRYAGLYPGIDALFYATQEQGAATRLEYDFVVAPGADPRDIVLRMTGVSQLQVDEGGQLLARAGTQTLVQRRPVAFQQIEGARRDVAVSFALDGDLVRFAVGDYDRRHPLTIDPVVVVFGTFIGGSGVEFVETAIGSLTAGVASDAAGNAYIAGDSASTSVVPGGTPTSLNTPNVFVVKLNAAGSQVLFATFIGGSASDARGSVALGADGRVFVSGRTSSPDFPVTSGAVKSTLGASDPGDAFLVRLDGTTGALDYATYFGGSGLDSAETLAVSGSRAVIGGSTNSPDMVVTANAAQPVRGGIGCNFLADPGCFFDGFVAAIDPGGSPALVYSTHVGGSSLDAVFSVAIDGSGRIVAGGQTRSADFPTSPGAFDTSRGGSVDAFVVRYATSGALDYATYFGGSLPANDETENARVAVDAAGRIYLAGPTGSTDLPAGTTPNPLQPSNRGGADAFVAKLWPEAPTAAAQLVYRTYLGGSGNDYALALTVDASGRAYIGGFTTSDDLPTVKPLNAVRAGAEDGFLARVSPDGTALEFSTYIGGTQTDQVLALDHAARYGLYVLGLTSSPAPVPLRSEGGGPAIDATLGGTVDGFLARLGMDVDDDGIDDFWEAENGLDPSDPSDADEDADGDGASNRKEFEDGTDPNVAVTRFFAEGYTGGGFSTRFALLNDDPTRTATVTFEFLVKSGPVLTATRTIPPLRRLTLDAATDVPGLADVEFSTSIRSNLEIAADRTMTWDRTTYGAHAETAVTAPASTWYLAEGATINNLQLFYLIQNPNSVRVDVRVRYLLSDSPPVEEVVTIDPKTRETLWVNTRTAQGISLDRQQLSAVITSDPSLPIIVERALYRDPSGDFSFPAGHASAGITQPGTRWLLAEGNTGPGFDLFVLLANPNDQAASVTLTYLLPEGAPVVRTRQVPANNRDTVWVNTDPELAATAVSTVVTSDVPIIVERAMWWPASPDFSTSQWFEAHNSPGAQATARRWVLAEGEMGVPNLLDTYILLANTSSRAGRARVRLIFEDDTVPVVAEFPLNANSRRNVRVGFDIGDLTLIGKRFGATVESVGDDPVELVVERAMYWTTGTQFYGAGTNALATPR